MRKTMHAKVLGAALLAAMAMAMAKAADTRLAVNLEPSPQTQPASAPTASAESAPATAPAPVDPKVLAILDALEKAGEAHQNLRADVVHAIENPTLGDSETRTGWVVYQKETEKESAKIRIHFETLRLNEAAAIKDVVDYAFDGQWAAVARQKIKKLTLVQIAPPGETVRALKLGEGPLPPLPFGQKTREVVKYFEPSTRPPADGDPPGTDYVKLLTRRPYREKFSFTRMEMWIDRKSRLPVKIISYEPGKNVQTVSLTNFRVNEKLEDGLFNLSQGWKGSVDIQPFDSKEP